MIRKTLNFLKAATSCITCKGTGEPPADKYGRCLDCYGTGKINEYYELEFNTTRMVCPDCNGEGTELGHGLKGVALDPDDTDPEFLSDYFGGKFDVACSTCDGRNVVDALDVENIYDNFLTDQQKDDFNRNLNVEAQDEADAASERALGC